MIPYLPCETARELLEAFVDGELPTTDQIAVQAHLRWCRTCGTHVEDLSLIGWSVRAGTPAMSPRAGDAQALAVVQSGVLTRIRAERAQSLRGRLPEMFADMRLMWPALGATIAVVACLIGSVNIWRLSTERRPGSLAGMLHTLGTPGSDGNPLRLNRGMSVPRVIDDGFALDRISEDEAVFAVATIVNQDGRVGTAELLDSSQVTGESPEPGDAAAVMRAFMERRFTPAQASSGRSVAVKTVFLLTRITVSAPAADYVVPAVHGGVPADRVKTAFPPTSGTRSSLVPPGSATA
jgi:hypothetical protein